MPTLCSETVQVVFEWHGMSHKHPDLLRTLTDEPTDWTLGLNGEGALRWIVSEVTGADYGIRRSDASLHRLVIRVEGELYNCRTNTVTTACQAACNERGSRWNHNKFVTVINKHDATAAKKIYISAYIGKTRDHVFLPEAVSTFEGALGFDNGALLRLVLSVGGFLNTPLLELKGLTHLSIRFELR